MNKMERIDNVYEITKRLCGMIDPVGDSSIDEIRHENLIATMSVVESLLEDIKRVSKLSGRCEQSLKKAGVTASNFLKDASVTIY